MTESRKVAMKQCYDCVHKRAVPGNAHIACANPDENMQGDTYGKKSGWWYYPMLFDPTWSLTVCRNHEGVE